MQKKTALKISKKLSAYISDEKLNEFIERALAEDVGSGDHTSMACIPEESRSKAKLYVKDVGILAGIKIAEKIFKKVDSTSKIQIFIEDGTHIRYGDIAFEVECNTRALLKAERLVLNIMQRMSGIASLSNRFHFETEDLPVKILDTRKTTPLIRFLEKWAVQIGGCENYRFGLYDWIMIKDNHIKAAGGVSQAIERITKYQKSKGLNLDITIEVKNLLELYEVLKVGNVRRIMLDNFEIPLMREAVLIVKGKYEVEASGGITINNVRKVATTGVDFISAGALTHSAQSLDLSLKIFE